MLLLTGLAPALGPRLSGLLATCRVHAAILAVFAHHLAGPAPAIQVLRGLLLGLFAFVGFFVVLGVLIEPVGVTASFLAANAVALGLQAVSLRVAQREERTRGPRT